MSATRTIWLIARREIRDRLANRGFLIATGVTLLAVIGFVVVPSLFRDEGPTTYDLGVVGTSPAGFDDVAATVASSRDAELAIVPLADRAAAEDALTSGDVDAVLVDGAQFLVEDEPDEQLQSIVDAALGQARFLDQLAQAGVDAEAAQELLTGSEPVTVVTLSGESQAEVEAALGIGFVATVLLFLMIQINAGTLLTGTIEEKSSRVVEVLLGTVRPWQLLAGKLVGMSTLAIGQLVLYVGVLLGANAAVEAFELPPATGGAILAGVVMFLIGFGFFASLYAVAGSLASSIEDAQSSAGPLGFLVAGIYMAVLIGVVPNPDGILAEVLTFLPPSAPFAVPARVAADAIPGWQIGVAALVTLIGTIVTVRLAGRLYSAAILAGGKLGWREVFRAEPIG